MPLLLRRTAVITGASRGLGEAIALQFAREGASVALLARGAAGLECLLPRLGAVRIRDDQQFRPIPVDLADADDVDRAARVCLGEFGAIDVLVNNAAVQGPIGAFEENDWAEWSAAVQVNLLAPARLCQLFIPSMRRRGRGKIINISGGGASSARPDFSAYASTKCGLVRLSETLAAELKADRIDVNAVAPGAMNTRMLEEVLAAGPNRARGEFADALKRHKEGGASPQRAAALVAMLASSQGDGITGRLISAVWDEWESLPARRRDFAESDLYTLRRVTAPSNAAPSPAAQSAANPSPAALSAAVHSPQLSPAQPRKAG